MAAQDETFRAKLVARTADGADNTLIVTRQGRGAAGLTFRTSGRRYAALPAPMWM